VVVCLCPPLNMLYLVTVKYKCGYVLWLTWSPNLQLLFFTSLYVARQGLCPLISPMLFCLCRLSPACSVVRHDKQVTSKGGMMLHPQIVPLGSPRFNYARYTEATEGSASRTDTLQVSLDLPTLLLMLPSNRLAIPFTLILVVIATQWQWHALWPG
jgi:hypothetical protein